MFPNSKQPSFQIISQVLSCSGSWPGHNTNTEFRTQYFFKYTFCLKGIPISQSRFGQIFAPVSVSCPDDAVSTIIDK